MSAQQRSGWGFAAIWLVLLAVPLWFLVVGDLPVGPRLLGLAGLGAFAVTYVLAYRNPDLIPVRNTLLRSYLWILALAVLLLLTAPALGGFSAFCVSYLAAVAIFCLPVRHAAVTVAVLLVAAGTTVVLTLDWDGGAPGVLVGLVASVVILVGVRWFADRDERDTAIRQEVTLLTERDQLARDVHDVLGHSLTVVSVKAELADRLLESDPGRARAELQDIQRLSREALHEIRTTVSRLRTADLAEELGAARTALAAAGIEQHLAGDSTAVRVGCRPLFAWVLREAVTNVVRHSGARRCWVVLEPQSVRVSDDGSGGAVQGQGLRGVRDRSEEAGGVLQIGERPGGGTILQVRVP